MYTDRSSAVSYIQVQAEQASRVFSQRFRSAIEDAHPKLTEQEVDNLVGFHQFLLISYFQTFLNALRHVTQEDSSSATPTDL